jgi:hypothetical protein
MKFLRTISNSLANKNFYQELLHNPHPKPIKKAIWYIFRVDVLAALFVTIILSVNIFAVLPKIESAARQILPPGTEILIRNGELTTNTNPIVVPIPHNGSFTASSTDGAGNDNLLVLDVTSSTTIEALDARKTVILITGEGIISHGSNSRYSLAKFSNFRELNVAIDEAWLLNKVSWLKTFAKFVPFLAFFLVLAVMFASSLFFSLIYALLILLIMKIQKKNHPYSTAYVVALYSRTFGLALGLVSFVIPFIGINSISVALQLIFLTFMLMNKKAIIAVEDDSHEIKG